MDSGEGILNQHIRSLPLFYTKLFSLPFKSVFWKKELGKQPSIRKPESALKCSRALPEQATFLLSNVSYCDLFRCCSMAVACKPMREEIDSAQIRAIFLINKNAANQRMDFWTGEIYKRARVRPIPLCPPKQTTGWYLCLIHRLLSATN